MSETIFFPVSRSFPVQSRTLNITQSHSCRKHHILLNELPCPGPMGSEGRSGGCGHMMVLKETKDSKDLLQWRCRKTHKVSKHNMVYTVKDVKVSIRQNSWLVDCKLPMEHVLELIYLWSSRIYTLRSYARIEVEQKNCYRVVSLL